MAGFTDFIELSIATNQGEDTGKTIWINATQVESMQAMEGSQGTFTEILFNSGRQLATIVDLQSLLPPPPSPLGGR